MSGLEYTVIYSKRKTLSLSIKFDGAVIVRAPLKTPAKIIHEFVNKYSQWIADKLTKINQVKASNVAPKYFYLGQEYLFNFCDGLRGVNLQYGSFYTGLGKTDLIIWHKKQLVPIVQQFLDEYVAKYAFKYQQIKFNSAKSRWGSCSSTGNISFSYRLLMLPLAVIQYVVAHELAHLVHHNHSKQFWQLVERLYPDYKSAHKWLRQHKYELSLAAN